MVADPIEAITAVRKGNNVKPATPVKTRLKESDFLYNTNYVIAVMSLTQICMKHQQVLKMC
jgi:hypothetical protein